MKKIIFLLSLIFAVNYELSTINPVRNYTMMGNYKRTLSSVKLQSQEISNGVNCLYAAGLRLGMTGAVKEKVKELDKKVLNQSGQSVQSIPLPPSNLQAVHISSSQIDLTWQDNSNNEDGFKIERASTSTPFAQLSTVGVNITSYTDTNFSHATRYYYYRVCAYNSSGNSNYSNEIAVDTITIQGNFDSTPIDNIENALIFVSSDAINDYSNPGGGYPPVGVSSYPPVDIGKIYMGVYNGRLYFKWILGGAIPDKQETVENNRIKAISYNIMIDSDNNISDGWLGAETHFQFRIGYDDNGRIWIVPFYRAKCIDGSVPEGKFEKEGDGILHSGNGGLGKNYFIVSFALSDLLGTVYVGQEINLQFWSEAESNLYHHFSFDAYPNIGIGGGGGNWDVNWKVKVQEIQPQ